jgi:hypothetical protein
MAQETFAETDHADIDRANDWLLPYPIENEFRTPTADVQCQDISHSNRQAGTNAEQGPSLFLLTRDEFDLKATFCFDSIQKLSSIARIANGTRCHDSDRLNLITIDDLPPFLETVNHAIHRRRA